MPPVAVGEPLEMMRFHIVTRDAENEYNSLNVTPQTHRMYEGESRLSQGRAATS